MPYKSSKNRRMRKEHTSLERAQATLLEACQRVQAHNDMALLDQLWCVAHSLLDELYAIDPRYQSWLEHLASLSEEPRS